MVITIGCVLLASTAFSGDIRNVPVLYPKENSIVGGRVNVVLDPADIAFFRVIANNTPYPVVATSQGAHAYQGVLLEPGLNVITVNVLAPPKDKDRRGAGCCRFTHDQGL